jgi:hypothetical protein
MTENPRVISFEQPSAHGIGNGSESKIMLAFTCDLELSPEVRKHAELEDTRLTRGYSVLSEILERNDTVCTFFTQGKLCETKPDIIEKSHEAGHEIGAHGYSHIPLGPIWPLNSLQRPKRTNAAKREIEKSRDAIFQLLGKYPVSFRAPYLRIDKETLRMVDEAGFLFDSSIYNPEVNRPSFPYHPSLENLSSEGEIDLFEVPITVSVTPKRKLFYHRHPPLLELKQEDLEREITRYIQVNGKLANSAVLFVPMVHPYEFCSDAFSSKVSFFLGLMKKFNAASLLFSELNQILKLPAHGNLRNHSL